MSPSSLVLLHNADSLQLSGFFLFYFIVFTNTPQFFHTVRFNAFVEINWLPAYSRPFSFTVYCCLPLQRGQIIAACGARCSICCNISCSRQMEFTSHTFPSWDLHSKASHVNKIDVSDAKPTQTHTHTQEKNKNQWMVVSIYMAFTWISLAKRKPASNWWNKTAMLST